MKRWLFSLWLIGLVGLASPAFAAGLIVVYESPPPGSHSFPLHPLPPPQPWLVPPPRPFQFAPLEVTSHQANARIKDQIAVTSIDQEFYNPNPQRLEGTFL